MKIEQIYELIYNAMDDIKDMIPGGQHVERSPTAALLEGAGGPLDSLGVVNLMIAVEKRIDSTFGREVSLADALMITPDESPFRTVSTLSTYITAMLAENTNA